MENVVALLHHFPEIGQVFRHADLAGLGLLAFDHAAEELLRGHAFAAVVLVFICAEREMEELHVNGSALEILHRQIRSGIRG